MSETNPEKFHAAVRELDQLCEMLEGEGVTVLRPPLLSLDDAKADPVGLAAVYAREVFGFVGKNCILGKMQAPWRNKDRQAVLPFLSSLGVPILDPPDFFECGDLFRLGKSVLVTMSGQATTGAGFRWLCEQLEPQGFEVWPAYLKREWLHGDYIVTSLREGLCLAHVDAFIDGLLPAPLTDWDVIRVTREEAATHLPCNTFSLRENVMLLPAGCPRVRRALERKGVDVIEVEFDAVRFWDGSLDCSTAEIYREGPTPAGIRNE